MATKYDCVYYWVGGTEMGHWKQAPAGSREEISRMGYVALDGNTKIGPPDDGPTGKELQAAIGRNK